MPHNKNQSQPQSISQTAATVGGQVPAYLMSGGGQPMPGQLEAIAQQLSAGGYGAPMGGGGDILSALKAQYSATQAAPQAAPQTAQMAAPQAAPQGVRRPQQNTFVEAGPWTNDKGRAILAARAARGK